MKLVQNGTNREFQLVTRPIAKFPKRNRFQVSVAGESTEVASTSNRAWAKNADWIEYIWIRLDEKSCAFVTLDYNESAAGFVGAEFSIQDGAGPKPVARVTSELDREKARIQAFKATWTANRPTVQAEA